MPEDEWLLTVPEAAAQLRISRSHFFKLKRRGIIETVKLGSRTVVPRREITRLIDEAMAASNPPEPEMVEIRKTPAEAGEFRRMSHHHSGDRLTITAENESHNARRD